MSNPINLYNHDKWHATRMAGYSSNSVTIESYGIKFVLSTTKFFSPPVGARGAAIREILDVVLGGPFLR